MPDHRLRSKLYGDILQKAMVGGFLLMAFVVPLYFSTLFHDYLVPKLVLVQVLTILLATIWVVKMALDGELYLIDTPLYYTILAFLAVHFISLFQAYNIYQGLSTLFEYLCYFLVSALIFHTVRSPRDLTLLAGTMALTGGIVAAIGLLQHNGIYSFHAPWNLPISTIGNVVFVAEYYDVVFPISLALIFLLRKPWLRIAAFLACFLMSCHLLVMGSRGGWVGAIVSFAVLGGMALLKHFRIGRRVLDMSFASVVVVGLGWPVLEGTLSGIQVGPDRNLGDLTADYWQRVAHRTEDALRLQDDSSRQRVLLWEDTVRLILDRPLVGVGVGNFEYNIPRYLSRRSLEVKMQMEEKAGGQELMAFRAHNEYLEVWGETGVLGVGVFCFLLYQIAAVLYSLLKRYIRGEENLFVVGLAAAVAASLVHSFFSSNLQDPASAVHFWMVVGLAWSLKLNAGGEERIALLATRDGKVAFGVVSAAALAFIGTVVFGIQTLLGDYYYHRGTIEFERSDYAAARAELEQAVRYRHPKAFAAYQVLGLALYNEGRWPQAVQALRESLLRHRNNATVYHYLGISLGQMGEYREAIAEHRQAVALNPLSATFRLELGKTLGVAGDPRAAIRELQDAARIDPSSPEIYHALGGNYRQVGDRDAAADAYRKALELKPDDPEILNSLAVIYVEQGDLDAARRTFQRLVEEQPDRPDYRVNLGVTLLNLGQARNDVERVKAALAACQEALKIDPDYARAYAVIGSIFETIGDVSMARKAYQEALKREPDDRAIQTHLKALEAGH